MNDIFNNNDTDDLSLRPKTLSQFLGQADLKELLNIYIQTALARQETLDHCLFFGPPGLGKTTLAQVIANEMNAQLYSISAPSLDRVGDLAAILSNLDPGDCLFIDEIHRLPRVIEEVLYSAMEDYTLDIIVGKDSTASALKIDLPPLTLIGATTRYGDLSAPLRDRFGIVHQIPYYTADELVEIIFRTSNVYDFKIDTISATEIAKRARGTPRVANRIFRRVRDFSQYNNPELEQINIENTKIALEKLSIDEGGLNITDHSYMLAMIDRFNGGPVGLNALAASIGEEANTIEDVFEPYLLQEGYIIRTPRGRMATKKAYLHFERTKDET